MTALVCCELCGYLMPVADLVGHLEERHDEIVTGESVVLDFTIRREDAPHIPGYATGGNVPRLDVHAENGRLRDAVRSLLAFHFDTEAWEFVRRNARDALGQQSDGIAPGE